MGLQVKAAMGKVKITPEEKVCLQGYDPETHVSDPKKDLLDDLYARVLLLENRGQHKAIVSVDCCLTNENSVMVADPGGRAGKYREFIPTFPEGTREMWARAAGTDENGISICATHTHTAPASYGEKYTLRVEKLIRELREKLAPVKFSVAEGQSDISAFRRPTLHADLSVPINQKLMVLFIETEDGRPAGAIVNYAVHPTSLRNPANRISGDIVGLAVSNVEKHFGDAFTALFIQGFSGDICPLFGDNGPTEDTYAEVIKGSQKLGSDILRAVKQKQDISVTHFRSLTKIASFPTRNHFYKPAMDVTLFALLLGDVLLLAVSGEVFNDYIAKVEALAPARYTFLAGLSNGYSGYFPTVKAFHDGLGGYEMNTTPYTDKLEGLLISEIHELMDSLK